MTDVRLRLSPPWVTYVNEIKAMFDNDPEIGVTYDNDSVSVKLYVDNPDKAEILEKFLPDYKEFGNVVLSIMVIPPNDRKCTIDTYHMTLGQMFNVLFDKNPVFAFAEDVQGLLSNVITYVVFKNKVAQFFNDNLNDYYGNVSTLYQEIAHELFEDAGFQSVCYCTDKEGKVGTLGGWL